MSEAGQPCQWNVHGLKLAGLSWGDEDAPPVLCLHGWLDNAASFGVLAPLLEGFHVVAPDLTGHGQSERRSADASYQIWDDLPEVLGIVETLGWESFGLIGHSRGAMIASLFAASFPERVNHLVLLDAVGPQAVPESEFPAQMRRFLDDKGRLLSRENRVFSDIEAAVNSRADKGISYAAAKALAERNLSPCPGGYTWTMDPRLQGASAVKLTRGQLNAVMNALTMPTLVLLAEQGLGGKHEQLEQLARESIPDVVVEYTEGEHHFHMESPAEVIANKITGFFKT